jgi:hypothetical protein
MESLNSVCISQTKEHTIHISASVVEGSWVKIARFSGEVGGDGVVEVGCDSSEMSSWMASMRTVHRLFSAGSSIWA